MKKTVITHTDDLDGSEAAETVQFGLDGVSYEIDLNDKNADQLRQLLAPFRQAARRKDGYRVHRSLTPTPRAGATRRQDLPEIREWASANGLPIVLRGRIQSDIVRAYDARNRPEGDALLRTLKGLDPIKVPKTTKPAEPNSTLPEITAEDRQYAKEYTSAATNAAIERLTYARDHGGLFPNSGGSITTGAVNTLLRKGFGIQGEGNVHRINGRGLALLELAEERAAAKATKAAKAK